MSSFWRAFGAGLRRLVRRPAAERDLDDEVRHYLEQATESYRQAGLSSEDAARAARVEIGSVAAVKEHVRSSGWDATLESVWRDILYGLRMLRRGPGFTIVAVVVLTLSIGANTAVFSIVNAIFLRPLAVRSPSELAFVYPATPTMGRIGTYGEVRSLGAERGLFDDVASMGADVALLGSGADTVEVFGEVVSANYFEVLGVSPRRGRAFAPTVDEATAATPVVVISDALWRRRFDADPNILGRTIRLRRRQLADSGWRYTVVGVMGPEFTGVASPWTTTDFWVPLVQRGREFHEVLGFPHSDFQEAVGVAIARRRPEVTIAEAQAYVTTRYHAFESTRASKPRTGFDRSLIVRDSRQVRLPLDDTGKIAPNRLAAALMGVAVLVLLIGVTNLAGLTIARGIVRRSEIAVRLTLGASRGRLARQLVIEGLLLSALGGIGGLVGSRWLVALFLASLPDQFGNTWRVSLDVPLDLRVLLFTIFVVLVVGVIVGLAPVRQAANTDLSSTLGGASEIAPRRTRSRLRYWIVIPQVCLCVALLLAAGIAVRTLLKVALVEPGYQPERAGFVEFGLWRLRALPPGLSLEARRAASDKEMDRQAQLKRRILEIADAAPDIAAAGLTDALPTGGLGTSVVARDGFSSDSPHYMVSGAQVTPGYFAAIGLPLRLGRTFEVRDTAEATRVAVVDEKLAALLWPGKGPIGQYLGIHQAASTSPLEWLEVVGVVDDVRLPLSEGESNPHLYLAMEQNTARGQSSSTTLVGRSRGNEAQILQTLKGAVWQADAEPEITRSQTLKEAIDTIRYPRRMAASLLVSSALVGLLLASLGLYGVISYSVGQRMKELGIRAALGADRADIMRLVIREGIVVSMIGSILGFAVAFAGIRVVSHQVFAIPTMDAATIVAVPLVLAAVVLLACYLPARRAARVDPMTVLRGL